MKVIQKVYILLFIAIFTISMVSATSNDKLPMKDEVTTFLTEMKGSTSSEIFNEVKSNHPTWNVDLFTCSACSEV